MFRQEIERVSLFSGLSSSELEKIAPLFEPYCLPKGQLIFEKGQFAEYFYILLEGEVVVNFKPYDGPQITVSRILPGGIFGWSSMMGRQVYTSAALADTHVTALRIRGEELRCMCERYPETGVIILERLASVIAERTQCKQNQVYALLTQGMEFSGKCEER